MQWSDIPFRPAPRMLRQFAGLWLVFFGGLAGWQALFGDATLATVLGVLGFSFGLLGLVKPQAVRPVFVAWMILAFPIGWLVSRVLLALLFYGVFTPLGLVFKLLGRDPLCRSPHPAVDTYWKPKAAATNPRAYFHQF